jgi:hypothetical protein
VKFVVVLSSLERACLTLSVVAMTRAFSPAAASSPRPEATDSSEAVVKGNWDVGHGEGKSRSLLLEEKDWNPMCSVSIGSKSDAALACAALPAMIASHRISRCFVVVFPPVPSCVPSAPAQ